MSDSLKRIWKARNQILEGLRNLAFHNDAVEEIAKERLAICEKCPNFDTKGDDCLLPGTQPCCKLCGCSMNVKARALSAKCDDNRWDSVLTQEEEDNLNQLRDDQV